MVISDNFYLSLALSEAWKYQLLTLPNPAVGAVVVSSCGKILSIEAHKRAGEPHAEVLALQKAFALLKNDTKILELTFSHDIHEYLIQNHDNIFSKCEIYVTLEPCAHEGKTPSCSKLLVALGLKRVVIGEKDPNTKASGGIEMLRDAGIEVECGIEQKRCVDLLYPFTILQQKRQFVFFKWAQRLDGSLTDGIISSKESRTLVHRMRSISDLLIVGGQTVRVDRPMLDARLCNAKAPDVMIYSKEKSFDKTIPLFSVPNRDVFISDNLSKIQKYHIVMIEGGAAMFEAVRERVDLFVAFVAPKFAKSDGFREANANFKILHSQQIADDILLFMRINNGK